MGSKIRDWQGFFRWFSEEQIAKRYMYGMREGFELLQCRLSVARLPFDKLRESTEQLLNVVMAGPLSCPAHQVRANGNACHGIGPS